MFAYCGNNPVNYCDPYGCIFTPSIRDFIIGPIPEIILAQIIASNYSNNTAADDDPETTTKNKLINDQNGTTGSTFQYGNYSASWNACEAIAVHNALVLLGKGSSLSNVMLTFQLTGAMIGDGYFGSNPYSIGKVLSLYGIPYTEIGAEDMTQKGVYIVSFWNENAPFGGLHTIAVTYDGNQYTAYNLNGDGAIYAFTPSKYSNRFICGYHLGG